MKRKLRLGIVCSALMLSAFGSAAFAAEDGLEDVVAAVMAPADDGSTQCGGGTCTIPGTTIVLKCVAGGGRTCPKHTFCRCSCRQSQDYTWRAIHVCEPDRF